MRKHEPILVGMLMAILFVVWLGFPIHASHRFAGSFGGGVLAVSGSALLLVPFLYSIVKRNKRVKGIVTSRVSMKTALDWHVYAGILGPILVLLHTGHNYRSPLAITLTTLMLVVVLSGFVGRFLNAKISRSIKVKKMMLAELNSAYQEATDELHQYPDAASHVKPFSIGIVRMLFRVMAKPDSSGPDLASKVAHTIEIAESIADVEYAISTHETFKRAFKVWLRWHIIISMGFYVLLALHVWSGIHFGLRWFQ
ncbi:MAG: hypothetical protein JKX70_05235 [Phycisphaerales bacterium]|nr:hypothetical protein [Phycisphaerales bacterium]